MSRRPRVTVLMPVFNAAPFLDAAITSVRRQSWTDLALLVVDDGSTDASPAIAAKHAAADARVRVEHLPHGGMVTALNAGLAMIDSELIARADADDLNAPDRLTRQIALLDAHPGVGVCGTAMRTLPDHELCELPAEADELRATLLFGPPVYHPTVLMRRAWLAQSGLRYDTGAAHAEDYDLWERADRHTRFANLRAPLVRYRCHATQVSAVHAMPQAAISRAIRLRRLRALGVEPSADELKVHDALLARNAAPDAERLAATRRWLERLRDANRAAARYAEPAFSRVLATRWYRCCAESVLLGSAPAEAFLRTSLVEALPDLRRRALRLGMLRLLPAAHVRRLVRWLPR